MNVQDTARKKLKGLQIYCRWKWHLLEEPLRRAVVRRRLRGSGPVLFRIDCPGLGLFAQLNWALWLAGWAERHGRRIAVECVSSNYAPGSGTGDWLSALVRQQPLAPGETPRVVRVRRWEYLPMALEHGVPLSMADARAIFQRHFSIMAPMKERAEAFRKECLEGAFVVGLHYRGTDKFIEAPRVVYDEAVESARRTLEAAAAVRGRAAVALFVASDEAGFLAHVKERLGDFRVVAVEEALRAHDATPLHQNGLGEGLRKGQEAFLDALLLGQSDVLLKTASGLSGWAPILGREMPVVVLSESFDRCACFPDSEIARDAFRPGAEAQAVAAAFANESKKLSAVTRIS